jgi:hypothetical protein
LGQLALKLSDDPNLTDTYAKIATGQTKQQIKDTGNYLLTRSQNYDKIFWKPEDQSSEYGFFRGKFADGS